MTRVPLKNVAHSVHQRLLNRAEETHCTFNELLQHYAMERFLYRLGSSSHADRFVLKGALMLTAWRAPVTRPTRDIDLLGRMDNSADAVGAVVREVCKRFSSAPRSSSLPRRHSPFASRSSARATESFWPQGKKPRFF